jgi:hypothetical protein
MEIGINNHHEGTMELMPRVQSLHREGYMVSLATSVQNMKLFCENSFTHN